MACTAAVGASESQWTASSSTKTLRPERLQRSSSSCPTKRAQLRSISSSRSSRQACDQAASWLGATAGFFTRPRSGFVAPFGVAGRVPPRDPAGVVPCCSAVLPALVGANPVLSIDTALQLYNGSGSASDVAGGGDRIDQGPSCEVFRARQCPVHVGRAWGTVGRSSLREALRPRRRFGHAGSAPRAVEHRRTMGAETETG